MLARDLVGWDVIETYDELLLANDSCYLVQPFDEVFARMDATACDWWGLQATYEDFDTSAYERLGRPLAIDEVEEQMRRLDLWRYNDFIHVGSYFVAYRKRVIDDPEFRARLDNVAAQTDKTTIILKYEIGFSRLLILGGHHLATFVDGILPYHPVYRESAFDLMRDGFPLLKRQFLYENPFSRPDLRRWKERVLAVAPGADVEAMERNLHRVAPAWSLHRSFAIRSRPDGTVEVPQGIGPDAFDDEDRWTPKHPHWWVFPVDARTGVMSGEVRGPPRGGPRRPVDPQDRAGGPPAGQGRRRPRHDRARGERPGPDVRPALAAHLRRRRRPQRRQPPAVRPSPPLRGPRVPDRARACSPAAHRPLGRA